jgi:Fic family protein
VPPSYAEGVLKERIVETLRQHPEGLTTQDISRLIGTHRHTATRYLAELKGAEIIHCRTVGPATLHYLKSQFKQIQRELSKLVYN